MFEKIKEYYDKQLWSIERVFNVVGVAITPEEYFEITGLIYPSKISEYEKI